MQDLKFKQDVEQAGIAWNQFTVCTCTRQKQECQQKFFVISILTFLPEQQNSSVKTESVSERKIKHCHQLKNCCCLLRCFRFIVTKRPCGQTLTNFHFLYFRSDTFETRTKESKKSSADKSQTVL